MDEAFALASSDQMTMFQEMEKVDLKQITTGWSSAALRTKGLLEVVDLAAVVAGRIFMAQASWKVWPTVDGRFL